MTQLLAVRRRSLRELNLAAVFQAIYDDVDAPSRAVVAARTGLTKATVSTLVDQLIEARLVRELPLPAMRGAGRPGVPLGPRPRSLVGFGLEVNVGYYGARALDLTGEVVAERVVEADLVGSDPAAVLGDLRELTLDLLGDLRGEGMAAAGARLALPGLVRASTGVLEVAPNIGWRAVDPAALLDLGGQVDIAQYLAQPETPHTAVVRDERAVLEHQVGEGARGDHLDRHASLVGRPLDRVDGVRPRGIPGRAHVCLGMMEAPKPRKRPPPHACSAEVVQRAALWGCGAPTSPSIRRCRPAAGDSVSK